MWLINCSEKIKPMPPKNDYGTHHCGVGVVLTHGERLPTREEWNAVYDNLVTPVYCPVQAILTGQIERKVAAKQATR